MLKVTRAVLAEAIFALAFLLLGLFVLYDAFTLEEPGVYSVVSPKTFELIIGFFTTFVALLLIIQVLRGKLGIAEGTEVGAAQLRPDIKTKEINISFKNFLDPNAYATPKKVREAAAIYPAGSSSTI